MKKILKSIVVFGIYCLGYVVVINISASAINNSIETLSLTEITSIDAMKSGQKDVFTFIQLKLQGIDVKSIQENILNELENM